MAFRDDECVEHHRSCSSKQVKPKPPRPALLGLLTDHVQKRDALNNETSRHRIKRLQRSDTMSDQIAQIHPPLVTIQDLEKAQEPFFKSFPNSRVAQHVIHIL